MGNAILEIRAHVLAMLSATRRLLGPLSSQLSAPAIQSDAQAHWLVERVYRLTIAHAQELEEHLQRLGGGALPVPGENGAPHKEVASVQKVLADDFAQLSLANAAALMLETNARALGFSSTAALAAQHRDELATLLEQIRELLPLAA